MATFDHKIMELTTFYQHTMIGVAVYQVYGMRFLRLRAGRNNYELHTNTEGSDGNISIRYYAYIVLI